MIQDKRIINIENQAYVIIQDLCFEDCQYFLVDHLNKELQPVEDFAFVMEEKDEEGNISYVLVKDEILKETLATLFIPLIKD